LRRPVNPTAPHGLIEPTAAAAKLLDHFDIEARG
jgi:hypothetical protein